ncbi:MAG: hypothetical protein OXC11_13265 [Rhodospirillales bacterium]|nr:hypothetical protein [Rhodospirillales bacterium]
MADHARRLLISGELAELVSGEGEMEGGPAEPGSKDGQTNVWLFRAGKDGEDEDAWLDGGSAFLGFQEVGDLAGCGSQEDVRKRVAAAHPDSHVGVITNVTTQLRQFSVDSGPGDLVVLPRKSQPTVAIGRIAGHYAYLDVDGRPRHTRPVAWEQPDLPKERLGADLLKKLGVAGTVCRLGGEEEAGRGEGRLSQGPREAAWPAAGEPAAKGHPGRARRVRRDARAPRLHPRSPEP